MIKVKIKSGNKIIEFNNNAKGIRDFIILLNEMLKKSNIDVRITGDINNA